MTKVLIVSDSHGSTELLTELKKRHAQEVDYWIHCGDSELTATNEAIYGFTAVKGNCDFGGDFPEEAVIDVAGYKILVVHGHLYSVKSDVLRLLYRAKELGADIACFGHSHQLGAEKIEDVLLINPGSIKLPRGRRERTYVILELIKETGTAYLHIYDFDQGEMSDLAQQFSVAK